MDSDTGSHARFDSDRDFPSPHCTFTRIMPRGLRPTVKWRLSFEFPMKTLVMMLNGEFYEKAVALASKYYQEPFEQRDEDCQ
ncbi:hypothetical protein TNCV_3138271 [Trichonephila clavipes]|nr:hypothetical protein TNCV_3138271 [Trichonephila clavipes]